MQIIYDHNNETNCLTLVMIIASVILAYVFLRLILQQSRPNKASTKCLSVHVYVLTCVHPSAVYNGAEN